MRVRRLLLWIAVLLSGPAGARADEPIAAVDALQGQRIAAIRIECTAAIDEEDVRRVLPLRVGSRFEPEALSNGQQRLLATQLFTRASVTAMPGDDGVVVVVQLVRKPVLSTLTFRGNETLRSEALRRATHLQEGAVFSDELRAYAVERVRAAYVAEGFDAAVVVAEVRETRPAEVDLTVRITEGEPLRVGTIEITSDAPVSDDAIRKAIGLRVGDRYVRPRRHSRHSAVTALLRNARYYDADVEVTWRVTSGHTGVLHVAIKAGPLYTIEFIGNRRFDDAHLLGLIDLPTRVVVTDGTWRELARRIRETYQEAGYYFARVDVQIEAGPPRAVRFKIDEGDIFHVAAVEFEGRQGVPAKRLLAAMVTGPPSWMPWRRGVLLDDAFQDDLKRLWFLYRSFGFESAQIVDYRQRVDREEHTIVLSIVVEEGVQTIVREIEHEGFEVLPGPLPTSALAIGDPLNPEAVESERVALLTALTQAGYLSAEVITDVRVEPAGDRAAAILHFSAKAGAQRRVGRIIVQNNFDTRTRVIRRELPFKEGDVLDSGALLRGQSNIYNLGLFRSVSVLPVPSATDAGQEDVAVSVAEKLPITLQVGTGYNTRDGIRGFAEVADNNLQGRGRRLSLRGDIALNPNDAAAPNSYLLNLGFREPRVADSQWNVRANWLVQRATRSLDHYSIERFAFVPAVDRTFLPGLQGGMEFQYEEARIFDVADDVLAFNPADQGRFRTVSFGPFLVYEGRDDPFAPRRGVYDSLRVRYAPGALGTDVPFAKVQVQHSQYVPLGDRLTLVYAVRGGWARALESAQEVPLRERFFLGGRSTVRGFEENAIGPQGAPKVDSYGRTINSGGDPLGGDLALNLNAELRFPLQFGFGGAVFVDAGGVYLQERPILLEDFRRSAGLGLQYMTPVGPLSLDYGFKLDRRSDESIGAVHFSIGTTF